MKVSVRMYHELWALGIETPACAFFFVNEQHQHIVLYVAFPNPRKSGLSWTSPDLVEIDDETAAARMVVPITADWEEDLGYWRQGDIWHVSRSLEEDAEVLRPFHEYFGLSGQLPNFGPEWIVNNVPFKYGWVSVRHKEHPDVYSALVVALTQALSLGYRRYLDFHQLEENLRIATREKVVERIRAEAMAMRRSGDLVNVLGLMMHEMAGLGLGISRLGVRFIEGEGADARVVRTYYTIPNPRKYGFDWTSPALVEFNDELAVGEVTTSGSRDGAVIEAWRRGESMTVPVTAQDIEAKTQAIGKLWGVDGHIPLQEAEKRDGNHIYIPFQFGVVGFRVSEQEGFHEIIRNSRPRCRWGMCVISILPGWRSRTKLWNRA